MGISARLPLAERFFVHVHVHGFEDVDVYQRI